MKFQRYAIGLFFLSLSSLQLSASEWELMFYNVENLFDTVHDEGKNDATFLPLNHPLKQSECKKVSIYHFRKQCFKTDWTEEKLELKMNQIRDVLTLERGDLPDILAVSEIENANVAGKLAKVLGYSEFVVSNSPDERGIDLAVFYKSDKVKKVRSIEHRLVDLKNPTRNILEVHLKLEDKELAVFVNHWPSQGNPSSHRHYAAKTLRQKMLETKKKYPGIKVIAVGDFNTIDSEKPSPFSSLLDDKSRKASFVDVHQEYYEGSYERAGAFKRREIAGSYFYTRKAKWNRLDRIIVSSDLLDYKTAQGDLSLILESYEIYGPDFISKRWDTRGNDYEIIPKRYNFNATNRQLAGYSDHYPVLVRIMR